VKVAYPDEFFKACMEVMEKDIFKNPEAEFGIRWGSPSLAWYTQEVGALPTRNYTDGRFEKLSEIDANAILKWTVKRRACFQCPIACGNFVVVPSGPYAGTEVEGPEYETLDLLGANCGVDRLDAIARANYLCDTLGIDTISVGSVIAWAMECFEKGIITTKDTEGLQLTFGNGEALVTMVEKIGKREGLGDILAEGVKRAAQKIGKGSERWAVHVKGLELPAYDPRASPAFSLSYSVADRGGCHLRSWPLGVECLGAFWLGAKPVKIDRWSPDNKAKIVMEQEHQYAAKFSLEVCDFCCWDNERLSYLLWTATGFDEYKDVRIFEQAGERIVNLTRIINLREGMTAKDDVPPSRIFEDPLKTGPAAGRVVKKGDFMKMRSEYYKLRGWDTEGRPTAKKLEELDMRDIIPNVPWIKTSGGE
jgi:aldehyde:ferredoxin oxidoreductase